MAGRSRRRGYIHEPLVDPTSHIRLLRFLGHDESGDICCTLHNVSLTSEPVYIAGSYEWGDPDLDVDIKIDGRIVAIRHNLWLFLHWLTLSKHELIYARGFYLWVDALCIDQNNAAEKGRQVQMMGRIFRQAMFVYAWLGWTGALDANSNVTFITEASCQFSTSIDPDTQIDQWRKTFIPYTGTRRPFEEVELEKRWETVLCFLKLHFWSRRWIVQEILLARTVTLIYDGKEIPWFTLQILFDNLDKWRRGSSSKDCIDQRFYAEIFPEIEGTVAWRMRQHRKFQERNGLEHLVLLLTDFSSTECEVAYDKFYSFLHLLPEGDSIPVDYECPPIQVFSNIVRATIGLLDQHEDAIVRLANELNVSPTLAGESLPTLSNKARSSHSIPLILKDARLTKVVYATSAWPDFDRVTFPFDGVARARKESKRQSERRLEKIQNKTRNKMFEVLKPQKLDRQRNRAVLKDSRVNLTSCVEGSQPASDNSETRERSERIPSSHGTLPPEEQDLFVLCIDGTIAAIPAGALFQPSAETLTQASSLFLCRSASTSKSPWYFVLKSASTNADLEVSSIPSAHCLTITSLARDLGCMKLAEDKGECSQPVIVMTGFPFLDEAIRRVALPCLVDFIVVVHMLHDDHRIAYSGLADRHTPYFYLTNLRRERRTTPAEESMDDRPVVNRKRRPRTGDLRAPESARAADRRHLGSPERHSTIASNRNQFSPIDVTKFHMMMLTDSPLKEAVYHTAEFSFEARDLIQIARVLSDEP